MSDTESFEARILRLEAHDQIRSLVARYGMAIDDHDLEAIGGLFCADAFFGSADGVMGASGRAQIVSQFVDRFQALGISNNMSHDHVFELDAADPTLATGVVSSHAELWRNGRAFITALRYQDTYRVDSGKWRFQSRTLSFLYYVPVDEYPEALGSRLRQRAYGDQRPADFPESIPGWSD